MQLSERLIAEICSKLRISGSLETGLETCGVAPETYRAWRVEFESGTGGDLIGRLVRGIAEAEAEVKMIREHQLTQYFEKNWQALAWWLERKYPNEYGPRAKEKSGEQPKAENDMESLLDLLPS